MSNFIYCIYIILFLFIPVFSASGNIKTVNHSSVIQVNDNLLTVKVRDIPLKKVLIEIAKQKHLKFYFYTSAEDPLITNFTSLPIEKGLARLLRNYSYAFTYDSAKSEGGEHDIRKVVILSNTGESQHRGMEQTMAYREEPYLYNKPHGKKTDYEDSGDLYVANQYYEENEDVYEEGQNYQERGNIYAEGSDFMEGEDVYTENLDILEEDMVDPLKESEPMIVTTGGAALKPLDEVPYDADMNIRNEEREFDILRDELEDEDVEVRLSAVEILGAFGGEMAIQALESALTDEDEAIRELAAEELSRLKEERLID